MDIVERLASANGEISIGLLSDLDPDVPTLVASEIGFSPLGMRTRDMRGREKRRLKQLVSAVRSSQTGAYVVLDEVERLRLIIVQTNRGPFYEAWHSKVHSNIPVWRDFYYSVTRVALELANRVWAPTSICVTHPTGHDWPPHLLEVVLEATWHLADQQPVELSKLLFDRCCLTDGTSRIASAVSALRSEREALPNPKSRPVSWELDPHAFSEWRGPSTQVALVDIPGAES